MKENVSLNMSTSLEMNLVFLINVIFVLRIDAFCVSGYFGSNKYLYGRTTYNYAFTFWRQHYYYSHSVPVLADRNVFVWRNDTDNCFHFVTLPTTDPFENPTQSTIGYVVHSIYWKDKEGKTMMYLG